MANIREKVKLNGERSTHLELKYVNNLSAWNFFKVLYGNSMFKMMLVNLLMLVFVVPCIFFGIQYANTVASLGVALPLTSGFGVGYAPWIELDKYMASSIELARNQFFIWLVPTIAIVGVALSGSFAVVRDSFWTGKLTVFKTFFKGVIDTAWILVPALLIVSASIYGIYTLAIYLMATIAPWIAITVACILGLIVLVFTMYLFVFFAVIAVHKQPLGDSMKTAWTLLLMNILPNIFKFILAVVPVVLILTMQGFWMTLLLSFYLLFGAFYTSYVWMHHMMRTFALFNPVEKKKIK